MYHTIITTQSAKTLIKLTIKDLLMKNNSNTAAKNAQINDCFSFAYNAVQALNHKMAVCKNDLVQYESHAAARLELLAVMRRGMDAQKMVQVNGAFDNALSDFNHVMIGGVITQKMLDSIRINDRAPSIEFLPL